MDDLCRMPSEAQLKALVQNYSPITDEYSNMVTTHIIRLLNSQRVETVDINELALKCWQVSSGMHGKKREVEAVAGIIRSALKIEAGVTAPPEKFTAEDIGQFRMNQDCDYPGESGEGQGDA